MEPGDDPVEQTIDDLLRGELDITVLLEVRGTVEQVEADHALGELVGPLATAELVDEVALGGEPIGLGVDERAVHVPEDGGRQGKAVGRVGRVDDQITRRVR